MNIEALLIAENPIPSHALAAITALVLGIIQLTRRKGTTLHKYVGYVWVLLMLYVSFSSFFIHDLRLIGPFSPIHFLSVFTIGSVIYAIIMIRRGEITKHKRTMTLLFYLGLVLTGAFTLLPNRIMFTVLFG
jgi:uncharacterized membrane protein